MNKSTEPPHLLKVSLETENKKCRVNINKMDLN